MKTDKISIVGGGLAGSECAYQLAKRGYYVVLYDLKPNNFTPAHTLPTFAELVCSNSLKGKALTNACGLLKEELKIMDSLVISCAEQTQVKAGGALAVDRVAFSKLVTEKLLAFDNIKTVSKEVVAYPEGVSVIATGPLTANGLYDNIMNDTNGLLHFYDSSSPIIEASSIDFSKAFFADRYGKASDDYLNCPMNKDEYLRFCDSLINAESVILKNFEKRDIFEGCMPLEIMAKRGVDTMRFGPLKPVGLDNNGEKNYAVVQLRKEDSEGKLFNLVGFQTNLKFSEQKRVFSMIPGLENANFVRFGVMHRNTFINAPSALNFGLQLKSDNNVFFAGQITGVEGYVESVMSGLLCAIEVDRYINGKTVLFPPRTTVCGALMNYLQMYNTNFQPMNANFGIVEKNDDKIRNKEERYLKIAENSLRETTNFMSIINNVD